MGATGGGIAQRGGIWIILMQTTKSAKLYIDRKQLTPQRQVHGRYAKDFIQSHDRGEPEVTTNPEVQKIPDPSNTIRTEVTGESGGS